MNIQIDTDMSDTERRQWLGYKSNPARACCQNCTFSSVATAPVADAFGGQPVQCKLGGFPVERGGLCYAWRSAS